MCSAAIMLILREMRRRVQKDEVTAILVGKLKDNPKVQIKEKF